MTAEEFEQRTGQAPRQDDLERVNCNTAGEVGHYLCGWCAKHDKPRFICGCLVMVTGGAPSHTPHHAGE